MEYKVKRMFIVNNIDSARKAYCSVEMEDGFILDDIAIIEGKQGLFVSMPQRKYVEDGNIKYSNIYYPITKTDREKLINKVLEVYKNELESCSNLSENIL